MSKLETKLLLYEETSNINSDKPHKYDYSSPCLTKFEKKRKIGNMFAFCYKRGQPIILIGPQCIAFIFIS